MLVRMQHSIEFTTIVKSRPNAEFKDLLRDMQG